MKIISKLFVIVLSLTLAACGSNKKFSLKGSIEGQNELNILIYSPNEAFSGYDTIKVTKGKFSYEQELTDSAIITLLFPKNIQTQIIAYPGDRLTYKVSASAMAKASVEGSTENELLTKYRLSVAELAGTSLTAKAKNFIKEHPQTLAAIAVFEQHILANSGREKNDLKETFELLHKSQPNNPYLTRLAQQLYAETQVGVGQKVPSISLQTLSGDTIKLGGDKKRATAILCWATWMEASLQQSALAQKLRKELQEKVDIVVVSLDYSPIEFKQRLGHDTLSLHIVCDGLVWQSPAVMQLGVRTIPGNILIDSEGIITARDVPHVDLEQKIRDLAN